ncbi:AAA family ATPase [Candidatus Epulonipiscioides gigas]|nr:AAA family ATPase [Epulopiscium sp. SCG-C07WGA-EpuloA2]
MEQKNEKTENIEGMVDNIIFQNEENGYTILNLNSNGEDIICIGTLVGVHPGEELQLIGEYITHHIYGKQFKVTSFLPSTPKTTRGIQKFLGSGLIRGVGERLSKKIVDYFGADTLKIIEKNPIKLAKIPGISPNIAKIIGDQYQQKQELRDIMIASGEFSISPSMVLKIYEKYKENALSIIKKDPYCLAMDISGISFIKADEIAIQQGIEKENPNRIKTGILFALNKFCSEGHTYCPLNILQSKAIELLKVDSILVENALMTLQSEKKIILKIYEEKSIIFIKNLYYQEQDIANRLLALSSLIKSEEMNFDKEIVETESALNITLVQEQKDAIKSALTSGVTIITGGPGTGKTTTINALLHMLKKQNEDFLLAAPTGRAAKRITESTGEEAKTIHRLLEITFNSKSTLSKLSFNRNIINPLETDILILDEMSMIDVSLMYSILQALKVGQRIVLIGDTDQLPSIGSGNVLRDIIQSEKLKVIRLVQIFRQAQKSAIVRNAHKINHGEYPVSNEQGTDFFFIARNIKEDVRNTIIDLISNRLPAKYKNIDIVKDIQVLAPMRKGILGVKELNIALQNTLNLKNEEKSEYEHKETIYRVGDKVMQTKNNYNTPWELYSPSGLVIDEGVGVYNGDNGIIIDINKNLGIVVMFDDQKIVRYEFNQLDELELSYTTTIHKSQGSEYPIVIIPLFEGPPMLLSRNLLYTAVTRAKKMVIIVGIRETVNRMIDNNKEVQRYTSLMHHLTQSL